MKSVIDRFKHATRRPEADLDPTDLQWFGLGNLMRAAKTWNAFRDGDCLRYRRTLYRERFDELIAGNGRSSKDVVIRDGWALDTSGNFPYTEELIRDAEQVIAQRAMTREGRENRKFLRDIFNWEDTARYPSFLNFICSSDILSAVCRYMEMIPVLSTTTPPGIRLTESSIDGQADGVYRTSQLHHLDYHDTPLVYVILLLRDVTPRSGPFTFYGAADSRRIADELGYFKRGRPYRLDDAAVHRIVPKERERAMACPKGSVLFIDSSRCFHYGSRDAVDTRYQMMYAYVSPCRADFTESNMPCRAYPSRGDDSPLRKLVLNKRFRIDGP